MRRLGDSLFWMTTLGGVVVLSMVVINGFPFVYFDTAVYLSRGDWVVDTVQSVLFGAGEGVEGPAPEPAEAFVPDGDKVIYGGRSVYYGAFAALPLPWPSPWSGVILQGAALAFVLTLFIRSVLGHLPRRFYFAILAALTVLTPMGVSVATAMPDIWAPILVLGVSTLWLTRRPSSWWVQILLIALVAFSALAHMSHLMLLGALTLSCMAGTAIARQRGWGVSAPSKSRPILLAACLVAGFAGEQAFRQAVQMRTGEPPLRRPFLSAHLIDAGPGLRYLESSCSERAWALCPYLERMPIGWRSFLFASTPEDGVFASANLPTRKRMSREDSAFAFACFLDAPWEVIQVGVRDFLKQVIHFGLVTTPLRKDYGVDSLRAHFPVPISQAVQNSRVFQNPDIIGMINTSTYALTIIALAVLGLAMLGRGPARFAFSQQGFVAAATISMGGVVLNALICGGLVSPYDRFQARIVWIVPLLAGLAVYLSRLVEASRRDGAGLHSPVEDDHS